MTQVKKIESTDIAAPQDAQLPADPMVSVIERICMDPDVPIERLERMMDMKERMEDRARDDRRLEAERAFYSSLSRAQSAIPVVLKNKDNQQTRSKYADLAAIEDQAMPVIREHGFAVSAWPVPGAPDGQQRVRYRVSHEQGHTDEIEDDFALDGTGIKGNQNKTPLHAKGSTVSYARRYFTTGYFNIATSDDDGNAGGGSVGNPITEEQFRELQDLIEKARISDDVVCKAEKLTALHDLPAARFASVKSRLEITIKNKAGK